MTVAHRTPHRTYAIPFDTVWKAALALANEGMSRWRLVEADDGRGVITALFDPAFLRRQVREVEVRIEIGLDENAQTRVDLETREADRRADRRAGRRAVNRFLERLDAEAARARGATRASTWSS